MHLDDDPVDGLISAPGRQRALQPRRLRAARVAADVERRAGLDRLVAGGGGRHKRGRAGHERARVLVHHVVGVEGDEQDRADAQGVPAPAETRHRVIGQRVAGQVGREPLRPVAELHLVITQARHPRPVGRRRLVVVAEVAPHLRLDAGIEVRVAQIAVQQVEQRLEGLDRLHRVRALAVGEHPAGVRRAQVAEAGEAERRAALRCGAEGGAERIGGVVIVVGGHGVRVQGARPQPANARVVGPDRLAADPVGVRPGLGGDDPLPDPDLRPGGLPGRGPGDDDAGGGVIAPGEMDLLGCAVAGRGAGPPPRRRRLGRGRGGREQPRSAGGQHLAARQRGTRRP